MLWSGHRVDAFRVGCQRFLEGSHGDHVHAVTDAVGHHASHHYAGLHWLVLVALGQVQPDTNRLQEIISADIRCGCEGVQIVVRQGPSRFGIGDSSSILDTLPKPTPQRHPSESLI